MANGMLYLSSSAPRVSPAGPPPTMAILGGDGEVIFDHLCIELGHQACWTQQPLHTRLLRLVIQQTCWNVPSASRRSDVERSLSVRIYVEPKVAEPYFTSSVIPADQAAERSFANISRRELLDGRPLWSMYRIDVSLTALLQDGIES